MTLVILNWDGLTHGPIGLTAIPPLSVFGSPAVSGMWVYEISLVGAAACWRCCSIGCSARISGRTLRAIRDDDVAARCYGIALDRYKSTRLRRRAASRPASPARSWRISFPT